MINTIDEAISVLAERTYDNIKSIKQSDRQRRNQVVDMYGVEFTRQGDGGAPVRFYISISPDMVYLERFEFKLIIQPFVSNVSTDAVQSAEVTVNPTELEIDNMYVDREDLIVESDGITPNPHDHTTDPHTHAIVTGVSLVHTDASDFTMKIDGVDVTPYLTAQYGEWIDGEGVYPSIEIGRDYDVLEVASDMHAEGLDAQADKLVSPGYKAVEISSSKPFQATLVLYLKYSHLNR